MMVEMVFDTTPSAIVAPPISLVAVIRILAVQPPPVQSLPCILTQPHLSTQPIITIHGEERYYVFDVF